jgi:hypothetical protein
MRRAFDIGAFACPQCGGRMRLIATVEDRDAIRPILAALALVARAGGSSTAVRRVAGHSHAAVIDARAQYGRARAEGCSLEPAAGPASR